MKKIYLFIIALCLTSVMSAQTKYYKLTKERTTVISKKYSSLPVVYKVLNKEINISTKTEVPNKLYTEIENQINSLVKDSINQMVSLQPKIELFNKKNEAADEIRKYLNSTEKKKIKKNYLIKAQKISDDYHLKYKIYPNKDLFMPLNDVHNQLIYRNRKPTITRDLRDKLTAEKNRLNNTPKVVNELTKSNNLKKQALILDEIVEDITTLSGIFKSLGNTNYDYVVLGKDIDGFSKNELLDSKIFKEKKLGYGFKKDLGNKNLIFNKEKNEYYLVDGFLLGEFAQDMTLVYFEKKLNKLGYKTESNNDDMIIYVNKRKLVLTNDIYRNVEKGNTNYINEIAKSAKQFQTYVDTSKPLTEKLVKHFSSHKNRTMTTTRLSIWKSDLKKAKNIYSKILSLKGNESDNIINFNQQVNNKTLDSYNDFSQVVKGSEQVLGM